MAACVSAPAFAEATTDVVTYENRSELRYWYYNDGAIVLGDNVRLNIYNITDGKDGNSSDVNFCINKSENSGAIHAGDVVMFNNGGIAFIDNENKSGGGAAIYACNSVSLRENTHDIIFEDNIGYGNGGAIYAGSGVNIDNNEGNISFKGNKGGLKGGAICAANAGVTLTGNKGNIIFSSKTLTAGSSEGAAIYAYNGVTITDNTGSVTFTDLIAYDYGGAIYSQFNDVTISRNGAVSFTANTAGGRGGAIFAGGTSAQGDGNVVMDGNTSVSFSNNHGGVFYGGAIYAVGNIKLLNNKGDGTPDMLSGVYFTNNTSNSTTDADREGHGGALYSGGYVKLEGNDNVVFDSNKADHYAGGTRWYSHGGAIYANQEVSLTDNGAISFKGNEAGYGSGGAIYTGANLTIDKNVSVNFAGNKALCGDGGALYSTGAVTISDNGDVTFGTNISDTGSGGAIYTTSTVTLTDNGDVTFDTNTANAGSGGAIYTTSAVSLTGNGDVAFGTNTAQTEGGAIYTTSTVTLSGNGDVAFGTNTANAGSGGAIYTTSEVSLSGNGDVAFDTNKANAGSGGAIYTTSEVSLTDNGDVAFGTNTAQTDGGAIYTTSAVSLTGNGDVAFDTNKANAGSGGAIYTTSTVTLTGNGAIKFDSNTASTGTGGAIHGVREITITDNAGNIEFKGNTAGTTGGAIRNETTRHDYKQQWVRINRNTGDISFTGNKAGTNGGAIDMGHMGGLELLDNTGSITFSDNTAVGIGGAIYTSCGEGVLIENNTGDVTFRNNRAGSKAGAIYSGAYPNEIGLSIRNNGNVLFEKNAVVDDSGNYILRSYQHDDVFRGGDVRLSAADGKYIEFRDSIAGDVKIDVNEAYNGVEQTGDVVFTGYYTEKHLNELLQADGVNRQATADEINASRQSAIGGKVVVHGGRLRVEDGAVLSTSGLQMKENAGATLLVKNATVRGIDPNGIYTHKGDGSINITSGNTLQVEGPSEKDDRAFFTFTLPEAQVEAGSLNATVGAVLDTDTLTLHSGSTLVLDKSHIDLDGGCLTLNIQGEDKINLVLTLDGMLMEDSIVNLFSDVVTLKLGSDMQYTSTDTFEFYASQFFSGSMIGEDTMVHFQNGSMTVTGLIPEPTTATLSLLALAALAARRRRK